MSTWRRIRSTDESMAQRIKTLLVNCIGYEGDELAEMRRQAYQYYFQRPRGDELAGRSQIVTNDLSAMVEGNLALMVEPLLAKRIVEFCSYDAADEEQANLESDCVHEMLFKRQSGFIEMTQAIKDTLLVRNAIVKVYVDERTYKQQIRRNNVAPEVVTEVLDSIGKTDVHSYDPKSGKLSATVTKVTRKFRVESLAPENFLMPKDWHRQDLEGIPFCAERHVETRSTLIERGFPRDKVEGLSRYNGAGTQSARDARLPRNMSPYSTSFDKSQDLIEWYECYVKVDSGNGTSELRKICTSGNTTLADDPSSGVCYGIGVCIVNPHTFMGISMHDKVKWVQDSTTALTRALMDNLNATNKNRTAHLNGVVKQEDLDDGRINSSIRVDPSVVQDVRAAITAFNVPDTSGNILGNLSYFKGVRSESGGAALDLATGQMQLNDRVGSQGLDRAYSVMEQLAKFMALTFAHTLIRSMYLVAHEVIRTQWRQPISFKRGNKWVQVDPAKWQVRDSLVVNMGKSANERTRESAVLERLMEKQATLAGLGMENILVGVSNYYQTIMAWLRCNDIDNPEKFVIDPRTPEAEQQMKQNAESAKRTKAAQDELLKQSVSLEQVRVALQKYQTDAETQFKYYQTVLNAQIEEAKITAQAVVDLRKAIITARSANEPNGKETLRITASKESATSGDSGEDQS